MRCPLFQRRWTKELESVKQRKKNSQISAHRDLVSNNNRLMPMTHPFFCTQTSSDITKQTKVRHRVFFVTIDRLQKTVGLGPLGLVREALAQASEEIYPTDVSDSSWPEQARRLGPRTFWGGSRPRDTRGSGHTHLAPWINCRRD